MPSVAVCAFQLERPDGCVWRIMMHWRGGLASPNCETAATGLDFSRPIASQMNRFTSPTGGSLCKFRKQAGIWAVGCRVVRSSVAPVTVPDAHALKDLPGAVGKRDVTDVGRQRK